MKNWPIPQYRKPQCPPPCEESQQQKIFLRYYFLPHHIKSFYVLYFRDFFSHQKNYLDISYQLKRSNCMKRRQIFGTCCSPLHCKLNERRVVQYTQSESIRVRYLSIRETGNHFVNSIHVERSYLSNGEDSSTL